MDNFNLAALVYCGRIKNEKNNVPNTNKKCTAPICSKLHCNEQAVLLHLLRVSLLPGASHTTTGVFLQGEDIRNTSRDRCDLVIDRTPMAMVLQFVTKLLVNGNFVVFDVAVVVSCKSFDGNNAA